MAELLLKCGAAVRSSLLIAVEMAFTPAVRLICEHLKNKKVIHVDGYVLSHFSTDKNKKHINNNI